MGNQAPAMWLSESSSRGGSGFPSDPGSSGISHALELVPELVMHLCLGHDKLTRSGFRSCLGFREILLTSSSSFIARLPAPLNLASGGVDQTPSQGN